jgi:isoaspartyl peptidase/L-asparaginase-like protein (Ntn-hydrolase superfamily)
MEAIDRRDFIKSIAGAAALAAIEAKPASASESGPVFLSTWVHGKAANERAAEVFKGSGSLLDAVEKGINVPEDDPKVMSVGYGGLPNEEGEVELDAAIMDGTRHHAGAVCSLRHIKNAISVARLVLEKTRHTTLAGEGAFRFALKMGFEPQLLLTPESLKKWLDWKSNPQRKTFWVTSETHDTIGMVATDGKGHMVSGCSTSGLPWKIPGRVGDSPLIGCGVYADDNVGAASATGDGDLMTNYCTSISIIHYMASGMSPQDACLELLRHMVTTDPKNKNGDCCVIAINNRGEIGAASMKSAYRLKYALWMNGESKLLDAVALY